jgi:hypothetical protein
MHKVQVWTKRKPIADTTTLGLPKRVSGFKIGKGHESGRGSRETKVDTNAIVSIVFLISIDHLGSWLLRGGNETRRPGKSLFGDPMDPIACLGSRPFSDQCTVVWLMPIDLRNLVHNIRGTASLSRLA